MAGMASSTGTINLFLALRWCREKVLLEPKLGSALGTFSSAISVSVGFIELQPTADKAGKTYDPTVAAAAWPFVAAA